MKSRITAEFGRDKLTHRNITYDQYPQIHVADLTGTTGSEQSIELYPAKPDYIDTLVIDNPGYDITATIFQPQCFQDEPGSESKNCEGVFYLSTSTKKTWVLFIEIKGCKYRNIKRHFAKAKEQIKTTVQIFRERGIITKNKRVHANISFPKEEKADSRKDQIPNSEKKAWADNYGIIISRTNHLKIQSDTIIAPK